MKRKDFLATTALFFGGSQNWLNKFSTMEDILHFKDDGLVPNSKFPLLVYHNAFTARGDSGAEWLENKFHGNNWSNSWRNGIFTFQHYHSITHEVLGIYEGEALVLLGGDKGSQVTAKPGDIIIIPAGVGHKNLGSENLGVVGAYPNGMPVDIVRAQPGDRPKADENIAAVPFPATDPLYGKEEGIIKLWKQSMT